jgi:hypothetical protein
VERSSAHWDQLLSQFLHRLPGGALNLHDPQMVALYKHFAALAGAQAGTDGMTDVFKVLICVSAALALLGLALPGRRAAEEAQQAQVAAASAEHVATVA